MTYPEYGVCRLSLVPVRSESMGRSEQVTQLLFGDHYEVTERSADKKWLKVRIYFDQYEGWINHLQHFPVTAEYFNYINQAEYKISIDLTSSLLYNKIPLHIVIGSVIPISSSELFKMEEQFAFNGQAKNLGLKRDFEFVKSIAYKYLHAPYQWGGKGPFGIDCSGFTQMVFRISGYHLFRDAWQQATQGKSIKSLRDAKPGDLVFFRNDGDRINHVGILLTEGSIIHASGRVRIDHINEEGILNRETKNHTHRFSHIRRILSQH